MNKSLYLLHYLLLACVLISLGFIVKISYELWQVKQINAYISSEDKSAPVPKNLEAEFAQAYFNAQKGRNEAALAGLTKVLEKETSTIEAAAHFNRGNIHLRDAQTLAPDDAARVSLLGLAKQDYRTALLIDSSLWAARYNLEIALLMAPEAADQALTIKDGRNSSTRSVKAVAFRVDLP
jgi:mxaK protein